MTEKTLILYSHPPKYGKTVMKELQRKNMVENMMKDIKKDNPLEEYLKNVEYQKYYCSTIDDRYEKLMKCCRNRLCNCSDEKSSEK